MVMHSLWENKQGKKTGAFRVRTDGTIGRTIRNCQCEGQLWLITSNFISFNLHRFSVVAKQITTNLAFLAKSALSAKILRYPWCHWNGMTEQEIHRIPSQDALWGT